MMNKLKQKITNQSVQEFLNASRCLPDELIQIAFLPPYAPDINPIKYFWTWLKRYALTNYCPTI